jgi:GT2 family glycosyltransferase
MKLSVVIVNYNVKYYLEQCLHSVQRAMKDIDGEIIVVDNHSRDGSAGYLKRRFPHVSFVESNHNLGFARANNIAIRQSSGEYVLLLNPDTFVGEEVLVKAIEFMDSHPRAGGAGVMMYTPEGIRANESRRGIPTPYVSLLKMLGLTRRYYMSHLPWEEPARIDVISGAFCLLRRTALDSVGLLDEDFFMYGEDIDLSYRLLKGGYENWYLPLPIVHYKGESTQKTSFRYVHVFYQAMLIFFRKHYSHMSLLITFPIMVAIYLRAILALIEMLYWRMKRSLGFFGKRRNDPVYVFSGTQRMVMACRRLARRKGLTETDNSKDSPICCLVMDTDNTSFADIITQLSSEARKGRFLGTYSCRSKVLITPHEIIH